ncbi:MAG: class I SAM-dependent methyltransferase [Nanoarchaeota archaeon]
MNYADYVKSQVTEQDWNIIQQLRLDLDEDGFVDFLADFVNAEKRWQTEIPFLCSHLAEYPDPKVFNSCLGSGVTSIGLKKIGIESVVSNDIDEKSIKISREEAKKYEVNLEILSYDWRSLPENLQGMFDAVLCLGNSLTYLFKREDQLKSLRNFRNILAENGKLIIDERNYAGQILPGNFRHSGNVVYCGTDKIAVHPSYVSESMVIMEYEHKIMRKKVHIVTYPFKRGEMQGLLEEAGFGEIKAYGDYKENFKQEEPEFITYVCRK